MDDTRAKMELLWQAIPRRAPGCTLERQQLAAGESVYILKDRASRVYMRLTQEGEFLWREIDGSRTIRELYVAYAVRFRRRAPDEVLRALARLLEAGFIAFDAHERSRLAPSRTMRGAFGRLSSLCTGYAELPGIDGRVTALYRLLRPLYTRFAQAVMLALAGAGTVVFVRQCATGAIAPAAAASHATVLWIASLALHVLVHEAAHALTCKHFGRTVHRAGVGWYLFAPVAFVDTSDMWAAARGPRVLVSAAGPYANLVLAGIAALAALLPGPDALKHALVSFSVVGYVLAVVNMNPLLELDGYYVLMDLLEIPNLRARAFAALGSALCGRGRMQARRDRLILGFGVASLAYTLAMAVGVLLASRLWIGGLAGAWLPPFGAHAVGWALAGAMCVLIVARVADGLRPTKGRR
jgi:putative peptide zinc metalloprotease protein